MGNKIKVLTSAMGLGAYVPALHISDYLKRNDYCADVEIFESFFDESAMDKYAKTKAMFQSSYKAAVLGHKLAAKKLSFILDDSITNGILKQWEEECVNTFVILSGSWISIVNQYMDSFPKSKAIIVHMDIGVAPSWKVFDNQDNKFIEIWPIDENGVNYIIDNHFEDVHKSNPKVNSDKFFLHGGGWGMGTYMDKREELSERFPNPIITTIHDKKEYQPDKNIEYTMIDPDWKPWLKNNDDTAYAYPPMYKVADNIESLENDYSNGLYDLYDSCCGIISKPGGGTLMDSLITETPIIFLESIAEHEKVNEEVWVKLGFGLCYESWLQSKDPIKALDKMKEKIQNCKSGTPSLGERLIKEIGL